MFYYLSFFIVTLVFRTDTSFIDRLTAPEDFINVHTAFSNVSTAEHFVESCNVSIVFLISLDGMIFFSQKWILRFDVIDNEAAAQIFGLLFA